MQSTAMEQGAAGGRLRTVLGVVALFLLLTVALVTVIHERYRVAITPNDHALAAATAIIDAELQQGDAIAFAPVWSAGQRWRMVKVYQDHAVDFEGSAILTDPVELWDVDGFERLWILTTHDHGQRVDVAALGTSLRHEELGDGVALLLIDLPPSRTVFDFRDMLVAGQLERFSRDGKVERCKARGGKLRCKGKSWRQVHQGWNEVGGTRHRCIYIQPHPARGVTRLSWANVPDARVLEGRFGNRLWAVRREVGSDVELRVIVGDRVRYELRLERGDFNWYGFRIDLDPGERGRPIAFELRADDPTWRQTCLDARLLGDPVPQ